VAVPIKEKHESTEARSKRDARRIAQLLPY